MRHTAGNVVIIAFVAAATLHAGVCLALTSPSPNVVTFDNQSGEAALVKVVGPTPQTVSVPEGKKVSVRVEGGRYYILVRYGARPAAYRYARGDAFDVTQTTTEYSLITITLHKVVGGNYATYPISDREFEEANLTMEDRPPPVRVPVSPPSISVHVATEEESLAWAMEHARKGDPLAQCLLGARYVIGRGVEQSLEKAREWYSKAANQGYAEGQLLLGTMYFDGSSVGKDYSKAYEWFIKAAVKGNAEAMGRIGMMHAAGLGVESNIPLAIHWFKKAGKAGSPKAQAEMGKRYLSGLDVPEDHVKAYAWFSLASRSHSQPDNIKEILRLLRKILSPEQISTANAMQNEWLTKESQQGQQPLSPTVDNTKTPL